jgi:putative methionine-R-sulfoxide reductase with GAF domain
MIRLDDLDRCLHGIIPNVIATADGDNVPNVSYVSQLHVVDEAHVAVSCQFFNKTRQNLDVNPRATIELYDPISFEAFRMRVRFLRSETSGELFDTMALRIQAIAAKTGMSGIFKLRSADVFEVQSIEKREGFIEPLVDWERLALPDGPLTELRGLQLVSERIRRAPDLDSLLTGVLAALDEVFGFTHGLIMIPDEDRLVTVASHGYDGAIGAEVKLGEGVIGSVAQAKKLVRIACVSSDLRYGHAIREQYERAQTQLPEIPLPRLADAESQMAIPLLVQDRLVGVLALETKSSLTFAQWHESFLQILANQIASGIDRMAESDGGDEHGGSETKLSFCYYRNDDCVFVDGEYLIRNVPGKILWKVLRAYQEEGRTEFSNRELRLDPSLGLPPIKDNLESRLILLRKRLEQKCPAIKLVPTRRGRFTLSVDCGLELVERETA